VRVAAEPHPDPDRGEVLYRYRRLAQWRELDTDSNTLTEEA